MKHFILIMLFSLGAMAQSKTFNFKLKDLNIDHYAFKRLEIKTKSGTFSSKFIGETTSKNYGFKSSVALINSLIAEFEQRKSLFPNGTVQFKIDDWGNLIISDKTIRLLSTGESNDDKSDLLKAQIKLLEEEVARLKEKSISLDTFDYVERKLEVCESQNTALKISLANLQTNTDDSSRTEDIIEFIVNYDKFEKTNGNAINN